tara:strand:+ start:1090 stop:2025 length:936 start_codon:yes stop_codon:yes gene_type:complete
MKVLVTGGAGYIGSILVRYLIKNDYEVTVLDNFNFGQDHVFLDLLSHKKLNIIRGDVCSKKLLKNCVIKNDIIIPLAGIVGAPACDLNKNLATELNTNQIKNILDITSKNQIIIMPVTNSGYGIGKKNQKCTEESPLNPISHYGITKVNAEKLITQKENFISLRLATVFGASNRMRTDLLVNDFTYKACKDKKILLYEPEFKRNYIHVRDVSLAMIYCIDNFDNLKNNIYNLGLEDANLSKMELCLTIKKYLPELKIEVNNFAKDPDKRDYIVSNQKILATGWKPSFTIDDGIVELIKCYDALKLQDTKNV